LSSLRKIAFREEVGAVGDGRLALDLKNSGRHGEDLSIRAEAHPPVERLEGVVVEEPDLPLVILLVTLGILVDNEVQ